VTSEAANRSWGGLGLKQIGLALLAALVVGGVGGVLLGFASNYGWTSHVSEQLAVLALSVLAYQGSVEIGGNGFVAAFVGGLLFGAVTQQAFARPIEFTETVGLFASFLVWTIFGALFVGTVVTERVSWTAVGYALLSLTVVRIIPVAIALARSGLRWSTVLFMGWFGPRGLASVVFTLIAVEEFDAHHLDSSTLVRVATWAILLSVVLHGLSAVPLAARYGASLRGRSDIPELESSPEPALRVRHFAGRRPVTTEDTSARGT
jgi:sodium/hydrogen antiporter